MAVVEGRGPCCESDQHHQTKREVACTADFSVTLSSGRVYLTFITGAQSGSSTGRNNEPYKRSCVADDPSTGLSPSYFYLRNRQQPSPTTSYHSWRIRGMEKVIIDMDTLDCGCRVTKEWKVPIALQGHSEASSHLDSLDEAEANTAMVCSFGNTPTASAKAMSCWKTFSSRSPKSLRKYKLTATP